MANASFGATGTVTHKAAGTITCRATVQTVSVHASASLACDTTLHCGFAQLVFDVLNNYLPEEIVTKKYLWLRAKTGERARCAEHLIGLQRW